MRKKRGCLTSLSVITVIILLLAFLSTTTWFDKKVYPIHYKEIVENSANKYNIEKQLVYAVIRTESKFDKKAKSPKGALGLMQIMPETARWLSEEFNLVFATAEDLFEPDINIELGTAYLAYLLNVYNGNPLESLAAYNAGTTNVTRWLNDGIWDGSYENVENIPYPETEMYINKVLAAYDKYRQLYSQ